jgi:hypothetical protein
MHAAFFVGDHLTRLAHVSEKGQRSMTVFFLCAPFGNITGVVIGITVATLHTSLAPMLQGL